MPLLSEVVKIISNGCVREPVYSFRIIGCRQEYIKFECATHTVVVQTSLSVFDVTAVLVVGREYD